MESQEPQQYTADFWLEYGYCFRLKEPNKQKWLIMNGIIYPINQTVLSV